MRYPLLALGLIVVHLFGCAPANPVSPPTNSTNATNSASHQLNDESGQPDLEPSSNTGEPGADELGTDEPAQETISSTQQNTTIAVADEPSLQFTPRPAWTTSHVQGSPDPRLPFEVEEVFDGLSFYAPVVVQQVPGTKQYLIGELCGRIYWIDENNPENDPVLAIDLFPDMPNQPPIPARGQEPVVTDNPMPAQHLYDLTFHPNFISNRQVFVTHLVSGDKPVTWLSRFELSTEDPPRIHRESERRVISWPSAGHNGGCVRFGPDGFLYVSTGDGVGPNPPDSNNVGQDISNLLASVLRIDVDNATDDAPYTVPTDNPFVDMPDARPEVWAYGFRNPWKMDFDRASGALWLGDVGWETWEMVHLVNRGSNYGWPIMEGRKVLRSEVPPGPTPINPPVKDYPRSEANSITGGIVYSGKKYPELAGSFIHGDYRTGHIWALQVDDQGVMQHRHLARSSICIIAFTETADGDIYVLDHDRTGRTFQLIPTAPVEKRPPFPLDLDATGLFSNTADLQPAAGVIPYEVIASPWMDGATAQRLLALPDQTQITVTEIEGKSQWVFPEGTVLVQTVHHHGLPDQPPTRLETRILHRENGSWHPYSYRWNDTQTNAVLVPQTGEDVRLPRSTVDSQVPLRETWHVPSRSECTFCHRQRIGSVLGFAPAQLERLVHYADAEHQQLDLLSARGIFDGDPHAAIDDASRLVDPHDLSNNLNDRARSYLDVNCGICHSPHGESITMFYLRRHYSLEEAKAFKRAAIGTFGLPDPHLIFPGDPYRSIILYRLGKLGNARMPYIGSHAVDPAGFQLIHDWILSLDGEMTSLQSEDLISLQMLRNREASPADHKEAISHLLTTTSSALALLSVVYNDEVTTASRDQIVELSQQSPAATVRSLFEDFIPETQRRPTLGDNIQPQVVLDVAGDAARGQLIFQSDASRCRTCHVADAQGRSLGADLREIGKKYPKPELLTHIIEPSLKMEPAFIPYLVETANGKVHSGLIVERNDEEIVLDNAKLERLHIPVADIEQIEPLAKSLMPERLLSDMTAQEAADLLEYLSTLRGEN